MTLFRLHLFQSLGKDIKLESAAQKHSYGYEDKKAFISYFNKNLCLPDCGNASD